MNNTILIGHSLETTIYKYDDVTFLISEVLTATTTKRRSIPRGTSSNRDGGGGSGGNSNGSMISDTVTSTSTRNDPVLK